MASVRDPRRGRVPSRALPSVWPGVAVGAALGAVVGAVTLLVPAGRTVPAGALTAAAPAGTASAAPTGSASTAPAGSASAAPAESESDYLHRAQDMIAASPAEALALAEAHPLRYPEGKLGQEREMIAIRALAGLGRKAEARARARVFVTLFPGSPYRGRIEALLPDLGATEKSPDAD